MPSRVRPKIIAVTEEQWAAAKEAADKEGLSRRAWIRQAIAEKLAS